MVSIALASSCLFLLQTAATGGDRTSWQTLNEDRQRLCDGGSASVCELLGRIYHSGQGAPRDEERAAQLYQRAAELHQEACDAGNGSACHRFKPATKDGRPVATAAHAPVTFSIY